MNGRWGSKSGEAPTTRPVAYERLLFYVHRENKTLTRMSLLPSQCRAFMVSPIYHCFVFYGSSKWILLFCDEEEAVVEEERAS